MTGTLVTTTGGFVTGGFVVTERQVPVAALKKNSIMYGQNHLTIANQHISFASINMLTMHKIVHQMMLM